MEYNWQLNDWTDFQYDLTEIQESLFECITKVALIAGSSVSLAEDIKQETIIHFMVAEAIKSSAIEGEFISREDVLSSIRNHFGLNKEPKQIKDLRAEGISKIMIDAYETFAQPLSKQKLNKWHAMLFDNQRNVRSMSIGKYRCHKEPMQVISGHLGRPKIHFEAPPSKNLNKEMRVFIRWFNQTAPGEDQEIKAAPIRAAIAHLYFESIHPYEDGNGRIGRTLAEKVLAQSLKCPVLLSLSQEIEANKKLYYSKLEQAQKSNEITEWIKYFIQVIINASIRTSEQLAFIINKSRFYDKLENQLSQRQNKVINRMLQEGNKGFEGGISARKYMRISKCSKATATRDLADLLKKRAIKKRPGKGRNTSYDLNLAIGL
jgi:Fic family protein